MPAPDSTSARAVFLSYASQDAEAAKAICGALRQAGVEVWFDQSELVGGDAWDRKIRQQIKECALFVPVISANTQARAEGYFRLEWLLAVERSRLMAEEKPFLVPVVIDGTDDATASVPEKFRDVQWTRLRLVGAGGQARPEGAEAALEKFASRVKQLLEGNIAGPVGDRAPGQRPGLPPRRTARPWLLPAALLAVAGAGIFFALKKNAPPPASPIASVAKPAAAAEKPAPPPQTEVQKLIARIWQIYEKQQDATRGDWTLAVESGAQAVKLEPNNAEAWAAYSQASLAFAGYLGEPRASSDAKTFAERAMSLAPDSNEAQFALANVYRSQPQTLRDGERMLRQLVEKMPRDKRVIRVLAYAVRNTAFANSQSFVPLLEEALALLDRANSLPGGDAAALVGKYNILLRLGRVAESEAAVDTALKLRSGADALRLKIRMLIYLHGDLDGARDRLDKAPADFWLHDASYPAAVNLWLLRRDLKRMLSVLRNFPGDYFELGDFTGPKDFLTGQAQQLAGNLDAAQANWRAAANVVDRRLAMEPNSASLLLWKASLLACLNQRTEALQVQKLYEQQAGLKPQVVTFNTSLSRVSVESIQLCLLLDQREQVLSALETRLQRISVEKTSAPDGVIMRNRLRFEPMWDPLRSEPRFQAVLAALEPGAAPVEKP